MALSKKIHCAHLGWSVPRREEAPIWFPDHGAGMAFPVLSFMSMEVFSSLASVPQFNSQMKEVTWLPQKHGFLEFSYRDCRGQASSEEVWGCILHRPWVKRFAPKVLWLVLEPGKEKNLTLKSRQFTSLRQNKELDCQTKILPLLIKRVPSTLQLRKMPGSWWWDLRTPSLQSPGPRAARGPRAAWGPSAAPGLQLYLNSARMLDTEFKYLKRSFTYKEKEVSQVLQN